ncbi:GTPase-activating protein [Vanrija albida]|uniref:GTPase-activating protein n=1 Tax=Vanrija albida TaxID=181172 RepID=A0ABR3PU40_9TREE
MTSNSLDHHESNSDFDDLDVTDEISLSDDGASPTASALDLSTSPKTTMASTAAGAAGTATKANGSSAASNASKVRGLAARWEQTPSTGGAASSTSPSKSQSTGSAAAAKTIGSSLASRRPSSPRTVPGRQFSNPKITTTKPSGAGSRSSNGSTTSSPTTPLRSVSPSTSFKATELKKGKSALKSSTPSPSARAASLSSSPTAVASTSPPAATSPSPSPAPLPVASAIIPQPSVTPAAETDAPIPADLDDDANDRAFSPVANATSSAAPVVIHPAAIVLTPPEPVHAPELELSRGERVEDTSAAVFTTASTAHAEPEPEPEAEPEPTVRISLDDVALDDVPASDATHSADTSTDAVPEPATPPVQAVTDDFDNVSLSANPSPVLPPPRKPGASLFSRVLPESFAAPPKDVAKDADATPTKDTSREASPPDETEGVKDSPASRPKLQNKNSGSGKSSFFSSATSAFNNFSLPLPSASRTHSAEPTPPPEQHTPQTVSSATLTPTASPLPVSSWRTTMSATVSSLLSSTRSANSPPPVPTSPSPGPSRNPSTAFILNRVDSASASRDRNVARISGGSVKLREGFERVRGEMAGAAREIRREHAESGAIEDTSAPNVDWVFWGAVVQDYEEVARTRPKDLSRAIQQGIPPVIRGPIWQLMSSSKSIELEETYKALLKQTSPYEKAIHKDLSRTFPQHKFFQNAGTGQESLFMVVKAYSLYDREVGYTQGLAFIVAALLLNMPDEEAFCVLVRLMDSYNLRSHYLADMPGLQLRLYQFDRLVEDTLPLLHSHLTRKGIKSSMYASQWFMTLFSYRFPLSLVYRVLDIVLAEGIEAVFRFALAILRKSEDGLLQLEFEHILQFLQGDIFETYRASATPTGVGPDADSAQPGAHPAPQPEGEDQWRTNDFVRDAYEIHITPLMLDQYESEWEEKLRAQNAHVREVEQLRQANRHLSQHVKSLEGSLATMNNEHVELVRQLVLAKIAKEDMENELVRYKSLYAQLAGNREDGDLPSNPSVTSLAGFSTFSGGARGSKAGDAEQRSRRGSANVGSE